MEISVAMIVLVRFKAMMEQAMPALLVKRGTTCHLYVKDSLF
jgi:hypothetical protein